MTPLASSSYLTLYSPTELSPSFLGLEAVVICGALLTFVDARAALRRGEREPAFAWLVIFLYGLLIEIISYNTVDNFTHGQFTVMLYHLRLPLYISALYPVFIYGAMRTVDALGYRGLPRSLAVGLLVVCIDMPFDVIGPSAGWWWWADNDPNIAYRWMGVPVTSYYWHLTWGGAAVALARRLAPAAGSGAPSWAWRGGLAALLVPVCGGVLFFPLHGLKALGLEHGETTTALFALAATVALLARRPSPRSLLPAPVAWALCLFSGYHLAVALPIWLSAGVEDWPRRAVVCVVAAGAVLTAVWRARWRSAVTSGA